jgi:predicted nucleotidyltransferase
MTIERDPRMAQVTLPPLSDRYRAALAAAVEYIFGRWSPSGVLVSGSIVRGNPGPESDFDIFVLHGEAVRQRVQRRFGGVPAELFVNPPGRVRRYFEEEARDGSGRPVAAHMFATGVAIYDPEGVVAALQDQARTTLAAGPAVKEALLTWKRYTVATTLEDALDIAETEPEMCAALLSAAVLDAARYRFWAAGRWQPRVKELFGELAALDPTLVELVRRFQRAGAPSERIELARAVALASVGEVGFFEWESDAEAAGDEGG